MPSKEAEELRGLSIEELLERLREVKREQFLEEMKFKVGASEKPHLRKALRRTRARILTILRERGVKL